jgi:hypothetical protein
MILGVFYVLMLFKRNIFVHKMIESTVSRVSLLDMFKNRQNKINLIILYLSYCVILYFKLIKSNSKMTTLY